MRGRSRGRHTASRGDGAGAGRAARRTFVCAPECCLLNADTRPPPRPGGPGRALSGAPPCHRLPRPGATRLRRSGPCQDRLPIVNLGNLNPNSLNDVPLHDVMHPQLLCCICPFAYLVRPPCLKTASPNGNMWACSRPTRHEGSSTCGAANEHHRAHHVPRSDVSHTLNRLSTCDLAPDFPASHRQTLLLGGPHRSPVFSDSVMHRILLGFTTAISCTCSARGTA